MDRNFNVLVFNRLESNDCRACKLCRINSKLDLYGTVRCFGCECLAGGNTQRFTVCLIHQCSRNRVFLSGNKVLIGDRIYELCCCRAR